MTLQLHSQETSHRTTLLFVFPTNTGTFSLSYLFLEPFLFCSSALSSSSSSQWSVSPSRMGGMDTLRTQLGLNTGGEGSGGTTTGRRRNNTTGILEKYSQSVSQSVIPLSQRKVQCHLKISMKCGIFNKYLYKLITCREGKGY